MPWAIPCARLDPRRGRTRLAALPLPAIQPSFRSLTPVGVACLLLAACGTAKPPGIVRARDQSTSTTRLGRNLPAHIAEVRLSPW